MRFIVMFVTAVCVLFLIRPDIDKDKEIDNSIRQNNIHFELLDKYLNSFAVNFSRNFTYIFGSVVYKLTLLPWMITGRSM